ncbi:uncharacterized protein LOC119360319 [Triticum dicoccoides]|uniref:uncharacterized protein LOC119360319 n=1 Tax=Triticum dicoccoides TaxID=85692 RepID=UPI001890481A|nr:uncharacterized protein LOC119360319 [Triticum dicoccoides]
MTAEQRAAYLQRNREYKRRRKNPVEVSNNVQSGSQTCNCTSLSMQATTLASTRTEGTGQHKRIAAFLDKGSGHKRRRLSNGASCSTTGKETHEHVVANEHEDHDSTIYVPNGCFPALEDESGQSEYMTEDDDEDDESYIFTGHGTECISSYQDPNHANCGIQDDPFDRIYRSVPSGHHVLEPVLNCTHCNAKRFQYENPTFCCMGGKVKIVTPTVPAEMRRLYTSQDPDAKYFQDNIRYFNSHFDLGDIQDLLYSMGKDIKTFDLPNLLDADDLDSLEAKELTEEMSIKVAKEDLELEATLNNEQQLAFDEIMDHVLHTKGKVFFIDGPGGTGKTYLYKALLAKVRSMGLIAIATATSGIAASIMPGGRTAHSRFKIPINVQEDIVCNINKQGGTSELLRRASLIIWDEVA